MKMKLVLPLLFCSLLFVANAQAEKLPTIIQETKLAGPVQGSPLAIDLDKDKHAEIVVAVLNHGLRVVYKAATKKESLFKKLPVRRATPSAADIDGDGEVEIVIGLCHSDKKCVIAVLDKELNTKKEFPVEGEIRGGVVIKDIDYDKKPDLVYYTANGYLGALKASGEKFANFPQKIKGTVDISETIYTPTPAVGNLDGDTKNGDEIVIVSTGGFLYGFHSTGKMLPAFPLPMKGASFASPIIGDLDGDGKGNIILVTGNGWLEARNANGSYLKGFPVYLRSSVTASPVVADINKDKKLEIYVGTQRGYVVGVGIDGKVLSGYPKFVRTKIAASPIIADMNGDFDKEVVVVTQAGEVYAFDKEGLQVDGYPFKAKTKVYGTPILLDWNNNAKANLILVGQDKKMLVIEDPNIGITAVGHGINWKSFQGGPTRTGNFGGITKVSSLTPTKAVMLEKTGGKQSVDNNTMTTTDVETKKGCDTLGSKNQAPLWPLSLLFLLAFIRRQKQN